jgi:hypothetical protein
MNVRFWQVHLLHDVDDGEATLAEVIGVVADSEENAVQTCKDMLHNVQILQAHDRGHVRFIRHIMRGPDTQMTVNGEKVDGIQAEG